MPDIFDTIDLDVLDKVELSLEDKVIFSEEMQSSIKEAVSKAIEAYPFDKIISAVVEKSILRERELMEKEVSRKKKEEKSLKELVNSSIKTLKNEFNSKIEKLDEQMVGIDEDAQKLLEKMREKYDELINRAINDAPQYTFGGFPPPGGGLPVSSTGISDWRIIPVGDNLSIQKYENGVWVEKGSFNP